MNIQMINFFLAMKMQSIRAASYLATVYQNMIKLLCVFYIHDSQYELYSLAMKRLNQTDENQIVVKHSILTENYSVGLPDDGRNRLLKYLDNVQIKNKTSLNKEIKKVILGMDNINIK